MKYRIDASIYFRNQRSIGVLNGYIDLPTTPCIGACVVLTFPPKKDSAPEPAGFNRSPRIEQIHIYPAPVETTLMLEDIVITKEEDIEATIRYLETGFDFYVDRTELNPD